MSSNPLNSLSISEWRFGGAAIKKELLCCKYPYMCIEYCKYVCMYVLYINYT